MNDNPRPDEVFEIEPTDSGGLFAHLPWWLILAVAFALTELTAHPAIGVSVLCLKFGWNDFRTALWLRRRDLNRQRGAVCSWFYLASGFWRVCLWSFGLMFVAIFFLMATEGPQARPAGRPNAGPEIPPEVLTCMILWMSSFAVATLLTMLAFLFAWRRRVKVWISGRISESRRSNQWPPRPIPRLPTDPNLLKWWLIGSGVGVFIVLFLFGIILLFSGLDARNRQARNGNNQGAAALFALMVGGGIPIVSAIFILFVGGRILGRIGANSPAECWPVGESIADSDPPG